jgi:hypothetical protein
LNDSYKAEAEVIARIEKADDPEAELETMEAATTGRGTACSHRNS